MTTVALYGVSIVGAFTIAYKILCVVEWLQRPRKQDARSRRK